MLIFFLRENCLHNTQLGICFSRASFPKLSPLRLVCLYLRLIEIALAIFCCFGNSVLILKHAGFFFAFYSFLSFCLKSVLKMKAHQTTDFPNVSPPYCCPPFSPTGPAATAGLLVLRRNTTVNLPHDQRPGPATNPVFNPFS